MAGEPAQARNVFCGRHVHCLVRAKDLALHAGIARGFDQPAPRCGYPAMTQCEASKAEARRGFPIVAIKLHPRLPCLRQQHRDIMEIEAENDDPVGDRAGKTGHGFNNTGVRIGPVGELARMDRRPLAWHDLHPPEQWPVRQGLRIGRDDEDVERMVRRKFRDPTPGTPRQAVSFRIGHDRAEQKRAAIARRPVRHCRFFPKGAPTRTRRRSSA